MIPRRLASLFIAAALVVAQQSALAHQIWHLAAAPAQQAAGFVPGESRDTPSGGNALCDLHTALGAVLGALGSADAAPEFMPQKAVAIAAAALSPARAAPLPPSSRGPPTLR